MDLAFHEMRPRIAERRRQRFQRGVDQLLIGQIGEGQRIGAGDQPVQHAVLADVVARAFIVDAAAAERLGHEPGARDLVAPERRIEQDRDAQVMRGTVEIGDVLDHRPAQLLALPADRRQPGMRQAHQHEIELAGLRALAVHHVEPVAALLGLADAQHTMIELDVGVDLRAQALDQLLIAVLDGIQTDIVVDIHHEVLERVEAVGVVGLGCDVGARHHLEEALGGGILDLLVEQLLAGLVGPGVLVVVRADALVILDRRHHLGAALAERLDGGCRLRPVFAAQARHVVEQLAVELHLKRVHRNRLQAEMLDQLAQRIGPGHRVVVDLSDTRFIHRRRRIEFSRHDLAAEPVGGFENRDLAEIAKLPSQVPGAHQAARTATNNRKVKHRSSAISGCQRHRRSSVSRVPPPLGLDRP